MEAGGMTEERGGCTEERYDNIDIFSPPYNMFGLMDRNELPEVEPRRKRNIATRNDAQTTHRKLTHNDVWYRHRN